MKNDIILFFLLIEFSARLAKTFEKYQRGLVKLRRKHQECRDTFFPLFSSILKVILCQMNQQ